MMGLMGLGSHERSEGGDGAEGWRRGEEGVERLTEKWCLSRERGLSPAAAPSLNPSSRLNLHNSQNLTHSHVSALARLTDSNF